MAAPTRRGAPGGPAGRSTMVPPTDEDTQTRFLRALADRLPLERVVEAHVFPAIRQGGAETGLAVIAARPETVGGEQPATQSDEGASESADTDAGERPPPTAHRVPDRLTVFSARYRLTLKGPDRGRWEMDLVAEADAPLVTVDAVVRGVQRRAGEGAEPERFTAEQLRALLGPADGAVAAAPPAGTSAGAR